MSKQIQWLRISVEGVLIVGSILLAFGIQAWWETSKERTGEQEVLRGLEEDVTANLEQLEEVIATHVWARTMVVELQTMSDTDLARLPQDSANQYVRALSVPRTFDARDGTLDAVVASGSLAILADTRLRNLLVEWEGDVEDAAEEARGLGAVAERVMLRNVELGGPWRLASSDSAPLAGIYEATRYFPHADLVLLTGDAELMGLVRWKIFVANIYLLELRPLADQAARIQALIQESRR